MCVRYRDMFQVLSELSGACYSLSLSNPFLQRLHLSLQLIQPVLLLQLCLPLLNQVFQRHIEPVYMSLLFGDLLAERQEEEEDSQTHSIQNRDGEK